jgi:hypothetical protein
MNLWRTRVLFSDLQEEFSKLMLTTSNLYVSTALTDAAIADLMTRPWHFIPRPGLHPEYDPVSERVTNPHSQPMNWVLKDHPEISLAHVMTNQQLFYHLLEVRNQHFNSQSLLETMAKKPKVKADTPLEKTTIRLSAELNMLLERVGARLNKSTSDVIRLLLEDKAEQLESELSKERVTI